jgi:hypothetical protein
MKFHLPKFAVAAALVLLSPLSGCPGHIDDAPTGTAGTGGGDTCAPAGLTTNPPATFATIRTMFNTGEGAVQSCVSAPCHGDNGAAPPVMPLSLQTGPNLYNHMMTYYSARCSLPLVKKGKPDESALIKIMEPDACGNPSFRMPFLCTDEQCMPAEYMTAIRAWISNCAPEN